MTILSDHIPIFFSILISFLISILFLCLSLIIGRGQSDPEKLSSYECGFNPFEDSRKTFDIKFYMIAIVFIVFDVELVLLLPLIINFFLNSFLSMIFIISFL